MSSKHWGEIESKKHLPYVPDVSADIEKSMNKFCLAEFDSEQENNENDTEHVVLETMDPLMLYAISLHKYINDMSEMVRVAELAIESNLIPPEDAVPPIPPKPQIFRKHNKNCLNFIPKDFTPFSEGCEVKHPEISDAITKQILMKCVATMFAHIGFETTHNSVLMILTDVLEMFLKKVSHRFKSARDEEVNEGSGGFPCFPEKVFMELGMGGLKGLHDYYQNRVVKYINVLYKRCEDMNEHYEKILIPKSPPPADKINKVIRIVEEDMVEVQMHFPGIDGEAGLSSLETGFQLLNSLEAETNLWESEDLNVTTSPGIGAATEAEVSTLSPFSKKKRAK